MRLRLSEENPAHPTEQTNLHRTLHKDSSMKTSVQNGEVGRVGWAVILAHQSINPPQNSGHLDVFPTRTQKTSTGAYRASSSHPCPCCR